MRTRSGYPARRAGKRLASRAMGDVDLVIAKLHEYLAVPAVVGFEGPFLRHLAADFEVLGRPARLGAGVLHVAGPDARPVLTAHVDRHGLVALGGGRFAYAAHAVKAAEYGEEVAPGRRLVATVCTRLADELVVAYDSASGRQLGRGTTAHRCDIDTDVEISVAGLDHVPAGTPAGFALGCVESGGDVSGQLDNAISAALAYALVSAGFGGQVVFTAREEAGWSARHFLDHAAGQMAPTQELIVLDTSPFPERDPVDGGTVVLRRRDAGAAFAPALVDRLAAAAAGEGIPYLFKDEEIERRNREVGGKPQGLGRTELGRIVELSGGAWNGATVQVPTTDYHTNMETTSCAAIGAAVRLLTLVS